LAHDAEPIARPTVAADIAALRVTLVGYGEVGRIFGAALAAAGVALAETFPGLDWERQATWFWRRVVQHGRRRAEEMREAAATVEGVAIAPRMASAAADLQAWVATRRAEGAFDAAGKDADWRDLADRIGREPGDAKA
jgi:hypothetical protein